MPAGPFASVPKKFVDRNAQAERERVCIDTADLESDLMAQESKHGET